MLIQIEETDGPVDGHKEGSITVENILKLPDFNDKNSDI